MKKLLKISALALAMSAVLFSCADPNNTTTPPTVETVKPSDVTAPESYTPTEGATAVTEVNNELLLSLYMNAGMSLEYALPIVGMDEKNATNFTAYGTKQDENETAINNAILNNTDSTVENSLTLAPGKYSLAEDGSFMDITEFTTEESTSYKSAEEKADRKTIDITKSKMNYVLDIKDVRSFESGIEFPLVSLKYAMAGDMTMNDTRAETEDGQKADTNSTTGTAAISVAMLFDTSSLDIKKNGILTFVADMNEGINNFTSVIFYDLNGKVSYEYKKEDLTALNTLM